MGVFETIRAEFEHGRLMTETTWNGAAFVGGMVNLCRPFRAIEVGAHDGTTSAFIAKAIRENGVGGFVAYEIERERCERIAAKLAEVWPDGAWEVVQGDFFKTVRTDPVDFAFIDIDPKIDYRRAYEAIPFADKAVFLAHDAELNPDEVHFMRLKAVEDGWLTLTLPHERGFLIGVRA